MTIYNAAEYLVPRSPSLPGQISVINPNGTVLSVPHIKEKSTNMRAQHITFNKAIKGLV